MPAAFMLDTNICIFIRKQRPEAVLKRFAETQAGEVVISCITFGELLFGASKSHDPARGREIVEEFVRIVPVLDFDGVETPAAYAEIRADLARRGEIIGSNDLWIAAHARSRDLTLITNNTREFDRVQGLRVVDWSR